MYHVAFPEKTKTIMSFYIDTVVEIFFWLDLGLNFIQGFIDSETLEVVTDLKLIA